MTKLLAAIVILGLNAYVFWYLGSDEVIPPRTHFASFPDQLGKWHCIDREEMDEAIIKNLKVTDYISCAFINPEENESVHLYIGYHERQTRNRETGTASSIHPPEHCLPGSGWDVIDSKIVPIGSGSGGEAKRFVIAKGNQRALVYFWYQSRGRVIARNHEKILWMFLDRARRGRTDGSLVRFTIPIQHGDVEAAEASFQEFERQVVPLLPEFIPD
ncbi:MAG TPA: EpsI family protein [Deltaproteobacteria bacterium]|nr:EpsI family protein [Deltaproteobacteria bacterium]